jgi:hypothetical protein
VVRSEALRQAVCRVEGKGRFGLDLFPGAKRTLIVFLKTL